MRKHFRILSIITLIIIIFTLLLPNTYAVDKVTHNTTVLNKVKTLQDLADTYITNTGTATSSTELTLQYLRNIKYNDSFWNSLLGTVDSNFIDFVGTNVSFSTDEILYDSSTGKEVDFIHLSATLVTYLKFGDTVQYQPAGYPIAVTISTHYSGWAGDLMKLAEQINTYITNNPSLTQSELQNYTNSLLGTNKLDASGTNEFSSSDMLADLDAINLYKDTTNGISTNLHTALVNYYINNSSTYNSTNRLTSVRTSLGSTETELKTLASNLLRSSIAQTALISGTLSDNTIELTSQSFANYVLGIPYLELAETSGSSVVGNADTRIKIYESNSDCLTQDIVISPNIASAKIDGEYLVITPEKAGTSAITVYSKDKTANDSYTISITNVAPLVTKDLDASYNLTEKETKSISITASGTNNIYTWYISDSENGTYTKIDGISSNTYSITPTMAMNNKYIKCGIKNDGNTEVFTKAAKITVKAAPAQTPSGNTTNSENTTKNNTNTANSTNTSNTQSASQPAQTATNNTDSSIVKTGDSTLSVAITIIVFVVLSNIAIFIIERKTY